MTQIMHDVADNPPEGYERIPNRTEGEDFTGPYYLRQRGEEVSMGFRVHRRHLNGAGVCHGGFLAIFADLLGIPLKRGLGISGISLTVNLGLDFVRPVPMGAWVEATPEVVRNTAKMLFFQTLITANGEVCVRANGTFRMNVEQPPGG